jgi:hypothetical protein
MLSKVAVAAPAAWLVTARPTLRVAVETVLLAPIAVQVLPSAEVTALMVVPRRTSPRTSSDSVACPEDPCRPTLEICGTHFP